MSTLDIVVELRAAKLPGLVGKIAEHHWLLVFKGVNGKRYESCDRWEVWQHAERNDTCWGHLHLNLLDPFQGVGQGPSRVVQRWSGDVAIGLIKKIENSPNTYPYCHQYEYFPGPNSNTFAQWSVGDKFKLGWTAFGKSFPMPDKSA